MTSKKASTVEDDAPPPPDGLQVTGRRLWTSAMTEFSFDVHDEFMLLQACRTADRLDRLEVEASAGPVTVTNFKGDQVAHPAMVEARQQSITFARLLAALRMPQGDQDERMGRPQRRGGARGAYGVRPARDDGGERAGPGYQRRDRAASAGAAAADTAGEDVGYGHR
jgi:hypothetical protein